MEQCIFFQIAKHESPAKIVYENDSSIVIMIKEQDVSGHLLAFSKTHAEEIRTIDLENWLELQNTIKKVSDHIINDCGFTCHKSSLRQWSSSGIINSAFTFSFNPAPKRRRD